MDKIDRDFLVRDASIYALTLWRLCTEAISTSIFSSTTGEWRPHKSPLCGWCSFQAWCPSFGGDPAQARPAAGLEPHPDPLSVATEAAAVDLRTSLVGSGAGASAP